jgi:hypothetical protein
MKNKISKIIDKRPAKWPEYYDKKDVENYCEYFIKGTNLKLGFYYKDLETGEDNYYCIVCDGYDQMDPFNSEEELFEHFDYILNTEHDCWRYYD